MAEIKLGSLFDGLGGFPLVATMCGIEPKWASEIEPFPVAVTNYHFPQTKQLGNICNINGAEVEPVDIITFGSPCQDLSIAGKRKGLKHEENGDDETTRSGLFMEAARIIKEMRLKTNGIYPRYAIWENVPGAFSSNKGEDFRTVLEELCKIKDNNVSIPRPNDCKWNNAGSIVGNGFSVAWRTIDAQFWGVPQRRRRIYLVADFAGKCAGEILFKSESVSWDIATSKKEGQGTAGEAESCFRTAICGVTSGAQFTGYFDDVSQTLRARDYKEPQAVLCAGFNGYKSANADITYSNNQSPTLESNMPSNVMFEQQAYDKYADTGKAATLKRDGGSYGGGSENLAMQSAVRRLTPTECARLQGYPDNWRVLPKITDMSDDDYELFANVYITDKLIKTGKTASKPSKKPIINWYNKLESDSSAYKAYGNSLALPCAFFVINSVYEAINEERRNNG